MKNFIAVILLTAFSCGAFASYVPDEGSKAKTEVVKKSYELVAVEVNQVIEVDPPTVQPINHITGEVNVIPQCRPLRAIANAPPGTVLENSPQESHRIRRLSGE